MLHFENFKYSIFCKVRLEGYKFAPFTERYEVFGNTVKRSSLVVPVTTMYLPGNSSVSAK